MHEQSSGQLPLRRSSGNTNTLAQQVRHAFEQAERVPVGQQGTTQVESLATESSQGVKQPGQTFVHQPGEECRDPVSDDVAATQVYMTYLHRSNDDSGDTFLTGNTEIKHGWLSMAC